MERQPSSERFEWRHPARIQVGELVSSRYSEGERGGVESHSSASRSPERPLSWDERLGGIDVIKTVSGDPIPLQSSPMQSPPKPGWVILITGGNSHEGYTWTLYGIPPQV